MTVKAALKAVRSRPEGGLHGHDPRQGPTFFAAKAAVSKPNDRRSQGEYHVIILGLELSSLC